MADEHRVPQVLQVLLPWEQEKLLGMGSSAQLSASSILALQTEPGRHGVLLAKH